MNSFSDIVAFVRVVEAHSEHGIVPPGTAVKVVALVNNRPTVRVA